MRLPIFDFHTGRLVGLLAIGIVTCACDIGQGERSESGKCPPGETCSSKTPEGLIFKGPYDGSGFGLDDPLPRLASAGRMTVRVHRSDYLALPPFDVAVDDPAILLATQEPTKEIRLLGVAAGVSKLRVLEAGTEQLLDRHAVVVEDVASVELSGCSGSSSEPMAPDAPGLLAGVGTTEVFVQLRGPEASYLVDEDVIFDPADGKPGFTAWSTRILGVPAKGTLVVRASSGGREATIEVPTFPAQDGVKGHWYPSLGQDRAPRELQGAELSLATFPVVCGWGVAEGHRLCNAPARIEVLQLDATLFIDADCVALGTGSGAEGPAVIRIGELSYADGDPHVVGETYSVTLVP